MQNASYPAPAPAARCPFRAQVVAFNRSLQKQADVILVDKKDYYEWSVANVRSVVDPDFAASTAVPYASELLGAAKLLVGTSQSVDPDKKTVSVAVAGGRSQVLPYDFLVVATGSGYDGVGKSIGATRDEHLAWLSKKAGQVRDASSILVLGGGPVALELVGDILHSHPQKKITIVSSSSRLLNTLEQAAHDKACDYCDKHKVEVHLSDRLVEGSKIEEGPSKYTTQRGKSIEADLVFPCWGQKANTSFLPAALLDAKARLCFDLIC